MQLCARVHTDAHRQLDSTGHPRAQHACAFVALSGADTRGSVDARDEFPHISEHSSQLGKLHMETGGVENRGRYTGRGALSACTGGWAVSPVCV